MHGIESARARFIQRAEFYFEFRLAKAKVAQIARAISDSSTTLAACADENCAIELSIFSNSRNSRCVSASCERTEPSDSESLLTIELASSISRLLLLASL